MKKKEEQVLGRFFWGYAGTLCHPSKVIPFVQKSLDGYQQAPQLVMSTTPSKYYSSSVGRIKEYSEDGRTYRPLDDEVTLIGCTYAVIAKNIRQVDVVLDLNKYEMANGSHLGKPLGEFIRYQINKGCAKLYSNDIPPYDPRNVRISYMADLVSPYCVFLK